MSYKLSQEIAVVATVDPLLRDNVAQASDYVDMSQHRKVMFVIAVGVTDTTIDAKLREATDSSGTSVKDISGKAITQLSGTDDAKQAIIEIDAAELDVANGFTHVTCLVTAGDGALGADTCCIALGSRDRYDPASDNDLASVAEIVS